MDRKIKIFLAEDNEGLRSLMESSLTETGFLVESFTCGKDFLIRLTEKKPDLMLLDYKLPDMKTPQLLDELDKKGFQIPFIIVTGHGDEKIAVEMMKRGAVDYLIKDIKLLDILPGMVKRAAEELLIKEKLKDTENQLNHTLGYYELLSKNIADVIWTMNLDQEFNYTSPSVEKLLGYNPEEMSGKFLYDLLDLETAEEIKVIFKNFIDEVRQDPVNHASKSIKRFELNLQRKDGNRIWTETQISSLVNPGNEIIGLLGVTRNIEMRKETELKLKDSYNTLYRALVSAIDAMGKTTEIRDPYTAGHQRKVARLAFKIASYMGLSAETCNCVKLAGQIHDIGKIRIPAEILSKPGHISENEYKIIQTHPRVGYEILHTIEFPWPIADIVLQHHERINGSGYPSCLTAKEMLIETKIISVADVVEAMASHRPYRAALGIDKALDEIKQNKGILYDQDVVESCIHIIESGSDIFE